MREAAWLTNTALPPRRAQGFSSTVRRLRTYKAGMISRPSSLIQRVYGVSFSLANFFARSSETRASFAIAVLLAFLKRFGPALVRPDRALRRRVGRDGDAFFRLHTHENGIAGGRAQRGMRPRLQHNITHLDLKIQILAEEILGVNGATNNVVADCRRRLGLDQLHVFGPHRDHDSLVLLHAFRGVHSDFAKA